MSALALAGGMNVAFAQTDVTSTYLTNADFSQTTAFADEFLYGYVSDGTPNLFQPIDGWTSVVTKDDKGSGYAGAVFSYGSASALKGNGQTPPAAGPDGNEGKCFGFFGVWGCGGYYYQDVTLEAGKYTITVPMFCKSGTQANTSFTGFFPTSGTSYTVPVNPTVGEWVNQTVSFTLTDKTEGQIRIGYQSTGSGSGANPMLFIDCVKIEFTAAVVKDALETAIAAATKANAMVGTLTEAIAAAQAVLDNASATQNEVNAAAAALAAAMAETMANADNLDITDALIVNADLASLDGWTSYASGASGTNYQDYSNGLIGDYTVRFAPATVDETHLATEYCFGFECRWSSNYASYNQTTVPVPAGVYTLTFDVENVNAATTKANYNNLFYMQAGSNKVTDTATEWMQGGSSWTTHTIRITVEETAPLTVSFGFGTGSNNIGSNNTPALYVSHIKLAYSGFIVGAKAAWQEAVEAAEAAKTDNAIVTGEELTALNAELAKAEPTTLAGYNEAVTALTKATETLVSAAASYKTLADVNSLITATGTLEYADPSKKPTTDEVAGSAAEADAMTASLYTDLRIYYESHALAEGVEGAVNFADAIAGTDPEVNEGWTGGIGVDNREVEKYTDAAGNPSGKYYDGGWSNTAGVNINMYRTIELPAGKYLLTVTARGSEALTSYTLSVGDEVMDLPHNGSGVNTGVFGHGWDDASLEFETDGTPVTLIIEAASTEYYQWVSFNRFRLMQLPSGGTTGIETIATAAQKADDTVYDLQGRRVEATNKGLYIVNGKKVMK